MLYGRMRLPSSLAERIAVCRHRVRHCDTQIRPTGDIISRRYADYIVLVIAFEDAQGDAKMTKRGYTLRLPIGTSGVCAVLTFTRPSTLRTVHSKRHTRANDAIGGWLSLGVRQSEMVRLHII